MNVTSLTYLVQLDLCSVLVWADLEQGLIVQAGSDWDWDIASWTDPALQSCQIQGSWFSVFWDTEQNRGGLRQPAHSYNCSRIISARINKITMVFRSCWIVRKSVRACCQAEDQLVLVWIKMSAWPRTAAQWFIHFAIQRFSRQFEDPYLSVFHAGPIPHLPPSCVWLVAAFQSSKFTFLAICARVQS